METPPHILQRLAVAADAGAAVHQAENTQIAFSPQLSVFLTGTVVRNEGQGADKYVLIRDRLHVGKTGPRKIFRFVSLQIFHF